jgi:hypothetical protein
VVSVHRPITCDTCNGLQLYQEDTAYHYRTSANHPSCPVCDIGFENKEALGRVRRDHDLPYSSQIEADVADRSTPSQDTQGAVAEPVTFCSPQQTF